jgi:hypothetical protein
LTKRQRKLWKNAFFLVRVKRAVFNVLKLFLKLVNVKQQMNRQSDREFHALSEYIITFSKTYFYNDKKLKELFEKIVVKSTPWKSDCESVFISLGCLFSTPVQTKI